MIRKNFIIELYFSTLKANFQFLNLVEDRHCQIRKFMLP